MLKLREPSEHKSREVAQERTGWRDEGVSRRHRLWGFDCPAVDLDFVLVEYDRCRVAALVEYKHERAAPCDPQTHSIRAMINLADVARVPMIGCRYAADYSWWRPMPLNAHARALLPRTPAPWTGAVDDFAMPESEFVALLYRMRGRECPVEVLAQLGRIA